MILIFTLHVLVYLKTFDVNIIAPINAATNPIIKSKSNKHRPSLDVIYFFNMRILSI